MPSKNVAVVTGSNKGIGLSIVRALCKQFHGDVYLTSRDVGRGQAAVKQLEAEGLKPKFHVLDFTDRSSVDALKEYFVKNYGGIDAFVHNAAIAFKGSDPTPFAEQAKVTIASNYTSTVYLCNTILPVMKANGRMSIVASQVGKMALEKCSTEVQAFLKSPDITEDALNKKMEEFVMAAQDNTHEKAGFANTTYGMSKIGNIVYTRILAKKARQLQQPNVLVNCCCPGFVKTDMSSQRGSLTPDEGAITPTFLALIPATETAPNGDFFLTKEKVDWSL